MEERCDWFLNSWETTMTSLKDLPIKLKSFMSDTISDRRDEKLILTEVSYSEYLAVKYVITIRTA